MNENDFQDCNDFPFGVDEEFDMYEHSNEEDESDVDDESEHEQNQDFLLAQQELEDFEQADEYFGGYGDDNW